mmetsp:Transcript_23690/g.36023  ORF Transcript_23690/g.36023 Transcript_23690/m.36023 type:complete len:127 (+) Transcript_23690:233-613(+)
MSTYGAATIPSTVLRSGSISTITMKKMTSVKVRMISTTTTTSPTVMKWRVENIVLPPGVHRTIEIETAQIDPTRGIDQRIDHGIMKGKVGLPEDPGRNPGIGPETGPGPDRNPETGLGMGVTVKAT